MEKRFIITAKITSVVPMQSWWYLACNSCTKKIEPFGETYKRTGKTCKSISGSPRYRLAVRAIDPEVPLSDNTAASIELVFFGPSAQELIGVPVQDLIAAGGGVGTFLPSKITSLYGKTYELRISVARSSLSWASHISFQVDAVVKMIRETAAGPSLPINSPVETVDGEKDIALATMGLGRNPAREAAIVPKTPISIHEHHNLLMTTTDTATDAATPPSSTDVDVSVLPTRQTKKRTSNTSEEDHGETRRPAKTARKKLPLDEPAHTE